MALATDYTKSVWQQRGINALYPPSGSVRLGDVLEYKRGAYHHVTTLTDAGIAPDLLDAVKPRTSRIKKWSVKSEEGVEVRAKVSGKLPRGLTLASLVKADAGAIVRMEERNSYLLAMSDIEVTTWPNVQFLAWPLTTLFASNDWDTSWIVVTELWRPTHCTFLASAKAGAQFELKANAGIKVGPAKVDISAGFSLVSESNDQDNFVDVDGTVPLFRGWRWLLGLRPAGRRRYLYKRASDATMAAPPEEFASLFHGPLVPAPFEPTP